MAIQDSDRARHEASLNRLNRKRALNRFISIAGLLSVTTGILLSLTLFLGNNKTEKNQIVDNDYMIKKIDSLRIINSIQNNKIKQLGTSLNGPIKFNNDTLKYLSIKINNLVNKFREDSTQIYELRASINPDKPEEVLRLARLNDKIEQLKIDNSNLQNNLKSEISQFEMSINNQMENSRTFYIALITILLPITIKFVIQLFKDFSKG